jgi:hypothetical protein
MISTALNVPGGMEKISPPGTTHCAAVFDHGGRAVETGVVPAVVARVGEKSRSPAS